MIIFIICSKRFYGEIPAIQEFLASRGHEIILPNHYDDPSSEDRVRALGEDEHRLWKAEAIRMSYGKVEACDAVLVINMTKEGDENYIGGATFLEMYDAFKLGKKIYLYNCLPHSILRDEIIGFNVVCLHQELSRIGVM
ncbi:hypothetical protein IPM19_00340 [bacterium]|nr:MAG: hypothetical protein IPM19_00340 [bacterium]